MIILDTHIWIWWIHGDSNLDKEMFDYINISESNGLGVNVISCWEIAKLVESGRLILPCKIEDWFRRALVYPGIQLINLTPEIAIESTKLPGEFHKDPADQIIVATARLYDTLLLTKDKKIIDYPHVNTQLM